MYIDVTIGEVWRFADLLAGLDDVPDDGDDGLDAEPPGEVLPVGQQRQLEAAPEDHVVTQLHLPGDQSEVSIGVT